MSYLYCGKQILNTDGSLPEYVSLGRYILTEDQFLYFGTIVNQKAVWNLIHLPQIFPPGQHIFFLERSNDKLFEINHFTFQFEPSFFTGVAYDNRYFYYFSLGRLLKRVESLKREVIEEVIEYSGIQVPFALRAPFNQISFASTSQNNGIMSMDPTSNNVTFQIDNQENYLFAYEYLEDDTVYLVNVNFVLIENVGSGILATSDFLQVGESLTCNFVINKQRLSRNRNAGPVTIDKVDLVTVSDNGKGVNVNNLAWDSNFSGSVRIKYELTVNLDFSGKQYPLGYTIKAGLVGDVPKITNLVSLTGKNTFGVVSIEVEVTVTPDFFVKFTEWAAANFAESFGAYGFAIFNGKFVITRLS